MVRDVETLMKIHPLFSYPSFIPAFFTGTVRPPQRGGLQGTRSFDYAYGSAQDKVRPPPQKDRPGVDLTSENPHTGFKIYLDC
jgi:hypothetical protein